MLIKQTEEMTVPERIIAENSNNQFLQAISYITVGSVFLYAGTSIPENFMICDGRSLDITEYAQLFDIIGYKFGGSNDIFKLPNLSAPQVSNCNYIIKTNDSISKKDFRFPIDYLYNPKSENAQSGTAVASALGNYLPIDREIEIELDGGDAGGNVEIEFVVDSAMSDTSSNPVENRVVKQYVDGINDKVMLDTHPIGSMYYSTGEENPAEIFGGTWEKMRSFYGGELIAYGRIQNTVSNTIAVTKDNVIVISDKYVPEKQYNIVNLIDGIITVDSGAFKVHTKGIVGVVEAQMIVSGRSETDCKGIWWLGNANEIPDGVEMWPNNEGIQPLSHIPSNSYGSGMNTYLYHIKDNAAEDTNFFVNPSCKAYEGSFTPCAGGTASVLIVKVFAKTGITHSWKRTA